MRILFTTVHSRDLVNLNVVYSLEKKISMEVECYWTGKGYSSHSGVETLDETVKRLCGDNPPDWVVSNNAHLPTYQKMMKESSRRDYKIAITLADLHVNPSDWVKVANWADAVMMRYRFSPYIKQDLLGRIVQYRKFDPEYYINKIHSPTLYFPWFTDPEIYKPISEKEHDVVFLGAHRKKVYPLRHQIVNELPEICKERNWSYLIRDRPPGKTLERNIEKLKHEGYIVGDLYAKTIASSKIFIFGNSIFQYPLSKYFEIMGSRTLILANTPQTSEELGFIAGENYVSITKDNWKEKLVYYLENESERDRIAENGYRHVLENHSTSSRSNQQIEFLKSL